MWYSNSTDAAPVKEGTMEPQFSVSLHESTGNGFGAAAEDVTICVIDEYGPCYIFEVSTTNTTHRHSPPITKTPHARAPPRKPRNSSTPRTHTHHHQVGYNQNEEYYPGELSWNIRAQTTDVGGTTVAGGLVAQGGHNSKTEICGGSFSPTLAPTITANPTMTAMPTTSEPTLAPTTPSPTDMPTVSLAPTLVARCYTLKLRDTAGDGWDGSRWTWYDDYNGTSTQNRNILQEGTLESGSASSVELCTRSITCNTLYVDDNDGHPAEVAWTFDDGSLLGHSGGVGDSYDVCLTNAPTIVSLPPTPGPSVTYTPTTPSPSYSVEPTTAHPTTPSPTKTFKPTTGAPTVKPTTPQPSNVPTTTPQPTSPVRSVSTPWALARTLAHGFDGMSVELTGDLTLYEPVELGASEDARRRLAEEDRANGIEPFVDEDATARRRLSGDDVSGVTLTSASGGSFKIMGDGSFSLVKVTSGSELTISGLELSGGGGEDGGALFVSGGSKVSLGDGTLITENTGTFGFR